MKKVLTLSLAIMMIAGSAMATDHFGIYTDQVGATGNCSGTIGAGVPVTIYVVHQTTGTTGSQFKVLDSSGLFQLGANVLGGFLAIGNAYTDLSLAYGGCMAGPAVAVVSMGYLAFTPPASCLLIEVVPAPNKPYPIAVDCNFAENAATAGKFLFNGNDSCPCLTIAAEQSTWGKVKSLYR